MKRRLFQVTRVLLLASIPLSGAETRSPVGQKKLPPLENLQMAHTFFIQGDYAAARKHYLEVLPFYPHSFDLLKNLAYCYLAMKPPDFARAVRYYAQAYALNPAPTEVAKNLSKSYMALKRYMEAAAVLRKMAQSPDAPAETWKSMAEAYDAARRIPEAEAAYDAYLQRAPGDLEARTNLGRLYSWGKDYAKALEQFRIVLAANPNFSPALIDTARVLAWQGHLEESLGLYDRILRFQSNHAEARMGKAIVLLWLGRPEEAQGLFRILQKRYPHDAEVARGFEGAKAAIEEKVLERIRQTGDADSLRTFYQERLATDSKDLTALRALANFSADAQRCVKGIEYARRAMKLSDDPLLELYLARSLTFCQQYTEAVVRYRRFLQTNPQAEGALLEMGETLLRARRFKEAIEVFRKLLSLSSQNAPANLGLARALAAAGDYREALIRYDASLKTSPGNYEALQGKAYVLYYTDQLAQARLIFTNLAEKRPGDPQNAQALEKIAIAEEAAHWAALRPPPDGPPEKFLGYYQRRLRSYPDDKIAMKALPYLQAVLNNRREAIRGYKQVLKIDPDDRAAKTELARLLRADGQYEASISLYLEVLKTVPDDPDTLENLARAYEWSGRLRDALRIYHTLLANNPSDTGIQLQVARLEMRLNNFPAAREALAPVFLAEPLNSQAGLDLAQMDLAEGRLGNSRRRFDRLLKHDPFDPDALMGKAQVSYYQGDLRAAREAATSLLVRRPNDLEGVLLLADIEYVQGHRRRSLALLGHAARISPTNPKVFEMKKKFREESRVAVHTSISFTREIGPPTQFVDVRGILHEGLPNDDLRSFTYGTTLDLSLLPRTASSFSFTFLPSDSPPGPLRDPQGNRIPTGITGAAGPALFLYRQSTRLSPRFTARVGGGLVRFGPGALVDLPGEPQPVRSATTRPMALAGLTLAATKKFTFDFDFSRSPVASTPVSVQFGVIEERVEGRLNFFFNPRTELHLDYFYGSYASARLKQASSRTLPGILVEGKAKHDQGRGGSIVFNKNFFGSDRFSFDGGYSGSAYGFTGARRNIFLGFFNPVFYQSHLAAVRAHGKLWGPVSYDFSGGIGLQRTELFGIPTGPITTTSGERVVRARAPIKRALVLSPALIFKASPRLSVTLGYSHYTGAQTLGVLRGNAVRLETNWKF